MTSNVSKLNGLFINGSTHVVIKLQNPNNWQDFENVLVEDYGVHWINTHPNNRLPMSFTSQEDYQIRYFLIHKHSDHSPRQPLYAMSWCNTEAIITKRLAENNYILYSDSVLVDGLHLNTISNYDHAMGIV